MTILICFAAATNLFAAALDCVSTVRHLSPDTELNPVAKRLMRRIGMQQAVTLCYGVIAMFTLTLTAACLLSGSAKMTALCSAGLLVEGALHFMAARVNGGGYGRWTRPLLLPVVRCYEAIEKAWSAWEDRRKS